MNTARLASALGLILSASLLVFPIKPVVAATELATDTHESPVWEMLRLRLFNGETIHEDSDGRVIALDVPEQAMDAAIVPVVIEGRLAPTSKRHIDRIWLVIDGNPSPLAADFRFTTLSGRADIETRVRIDKPGQVRVIARLDDGSLHHASQYVMASGGCSVPMNKDPDASAPDYGEVRLRVRGRPVQGEPFLAQLMVRHPNTSGFAINPATRLPQSAHFVRHIAIEYSGEPVLDADVDFSISENPSFRFWFTPKGEGEISARIVDSDDRQFSQTLSIKPRTPY